VVVSVRKTVIVPLSLTLAEKARGRAQLESLRREAAMLGKEAAMVEA
jgi:hypothetical protein